MSTTGRRWNVHGKPTIKRFREKCLINPVTGCWEWLSGKDKDGYGRFKAGGNTWQAHIYSYEHFVGPVPDGSELHHSCENTGCVNWAHVSPVTDKEHICDLTPAAPAYKNKRKTSCLLGHPLIEGNLDPHELNRGHRTCLTCRRARGAVRAASKRRERGVKFTGVRGPYKRVVYCHEDSQVLGQAFCS